MKGNSVMYYPERASRFVVAFFLLLCLLFLASCASSQSFSATATSAQKTLSGLQGTVSVPLVHNPIGTAQLIWKPATRMLSVTLSLSGLAPGSTHPAHIHLGRCERAAGQIIYPLTELKADAQGKASAATTIRGVTRGIPSTGWFVNVHNGPTLATELEGRWLACGNVSSVATGTEGTQTAQVPLGATPFPDEQVQGTAIFSLTSTTQIKVVVTLRDLMMASKHMAHLHRGSCEAQGPVVVPLKPVVADGRGNGTSTTLVPLSSIQAGPLYLNVHEGPMPTHANQPILQQLFNPIACGNLPVQL